VFDFSSCCQVVFLFFAGARLTHALGPRFFRGGLIFQRRVILRDALKSCLLSWGFGTGSSAGAAHALGSVVGESVLDQEIETLLAKLANNYGEDKQPVENRALRVSEMLLGRPFALGPTGEGVSEPLGLPMLRLDSFDCLTFVETVIAFSLAASLTEVIRIVQILRYGSRRPSFKTRNHFVSADWIPSALQNHVLKYSPAIKDQSTVKFAVDSGAWCDRLPLNPMYRAHFISENSGATGVIGNCDALRGIRIAKLLYLPLRRVKPDLHFTPGEILAVLRPGSPQNVSAGGGDHVSHVGVIVRHLDGWFLRTSSQVRGCVADVPIRDLFRSTSGLNGAYGVTLLGMLPPA
jgi:Protein of unknown function (DUF1460)